MSETEQKKPDPENAETPENADKKSDTQTDSQFENKRAEAEQAETEQPSEEAPQLSPLEEAQAEIATLKEDNVRLIAEMENLRKRTQKELQDFKKYAISPLAKDLFPVSDNLGRALDAITSEQKENADDGIKNLIIGLEMVASEFTGAFEKNNIKTITPAVGDKFDVATMQAMQEVEGTDIPTGCVVQCLQSAYILNDRLLRPAMILVAK